MNLKWIHIKNYRSCKDLKIELGSMHALVGANSAGKSSILKAIDILLNPSASKIDNECFWDGDTSLKIWIEAVFDNLTEEELGNDRLRPREGEKLHPPLICPKFT